MRKDQSAKSQVDLSVQHEKKGDISLTRANTAGGSIYVVKAPFELKLFLPPLIS